MQRPSITQVHESDGAVYTGAESGGMRRTIVVAGAAAKLQQQAQVAQDEAGGRRGIIRRQRPDRAAAKAADAGEAAGGTLRGDRHMVRQEFGGTHRLAIRPIFEPARQVKQP